MLKPMRYCLSRIPKKKKKKNLRWKVLDMTTSNRHYRKRHHLHSLYALSEDIDRNKSDNEFVTSIHDYANDDFGALQGGNREIIYFIDSNIALSFVRPYSDIEALTGDFGSFRRAYSRDGAGAYDSQTRPEEPSTDIRAILLMLSAEYIFSNDLIGKKNGLHLTPWHRQEVAKYLFDTHSACMRRLSKEGGKSALTSKIISDLKTIAENASPRNETQFRSLATSIASEDAVIPLHMIERILNGKTIRSDIETRKLEKRIPNANWKGIVEYKSKRKSDITETVDAQSLSYMQWIADNALGNDERLVFITEDEGLANWYNEWFYEGHSETGYTPRNYIVRRWSQYLPQLNLTNAKNILSWEDREKSLGLFNKIRQIVELIIAPDMMRLLDRNLGTLTNEDFESYESKHRISAALKKSIDGILNGLVEIETKSIFLFGEYLSRRIPDKLLEIAKSLDENDASEAIEQYIRERSDPRHAVAYFAEDLPNVDQTIWRRIPQTLHFPIGGKKLYEFIQESIENRAVDKKIIKDATPAAVFAICAGIIHATKSDYVPLRLASRYAQLSFEVCMQDTGSDGSLMASEAKFLCAVSNRFLIGHSENIAVATKHFTKVSTLLDQISTNLEPDESDAIRFDAERGAAMLFMAAQHFIHDDNNEGNRYLSDAEALLKECAARKNLYGSEPDCWLEIRRHYTHNLAAVHVLRTLTSPTSKQSTPSRELKQSVITIVDMLANEKNPPLFLQAELYYFLSLNDGSYASKALAYLERYRSQDGQKLIVDHWQAEEMYGKLIAHEQ
jgi:hypothetical protein